jgi:hypothetical protein
MASGAAGGAAAGLGGGIVAGVGAGAVGGFLTGGPVGAAIGAGAGLLGGMIHDIPKTSQSGISDYMLGHGSPSEGGAAIHVQGILSALNKIAGIRSRL